MPSRGVDRILENQEPNEIQRHGDTGDDSEISGNSRCLCASGAHSALLIPTLLRFHRIVASGGGPLAAPAVAQQAEGAGAEQGKGGGFGDEGHD